ncbi:PHD and RING finger domain-containing protein 1 isoform X2 [Boleophthalmus pectinirostris]|uniref:PHD and RING finger domain-containing protein 1 isoform X2 n=1 Tax=Boleophthalmus pectinirostris TaxID=150288 RepID=UPI00242D0EA0|nr:PHD and RING finger domain-containing protein 1 isoform X2 [Boleophthalmus pectinirostris]
MDEDDSQDELINRSSKSKGKRAATWAISDDSDEAGSDEEVESQSGEEDDTLDEEDEEDEDEDEEDEEDGVEPKEEGCAGTSANAEVSSDEEAEKCPICLHSFNRQPVATPENCEHYFCLDCILEWSKNANSCPIDRTNFKVIYLRTCFGGKVQKAITVQKPAKQCEQETVDVDLEETSCEVCGGSDREDRLLLCDGCDAGYHMECLTPPLDAVPVEEWFCPECEANSRHSRASATETSDTDSLPSTARHASSRPRSHMGGTRAIARTQHSERVRANVNRHRITQARTQELAPTYLIRSTWLDETINAVVAGLNTAVYVRDLTSRPSSTRRRKTRKVHGRKTSSKSKKGKSASTGGKRRKRRVRRTKSRKKLVMKKTPTIRSRIANNLGIVKDKKSSSLPTVYRPSESTLSSMRADIGAASLSIYGDPFDLDPFTDREDEEEQTHDSALFEAKRRGISRSAFRSHQPVARPVSLSRRPVSIPQASSVVEAAPVPDLLGSILSGQSMLLMDSSDVVINRDGSLKTSKPISVTNPMRPGSSRSSSAGDSGSQTTDVDRLGSSESPMNTHFSQNSSPLSSPLGSSLNLSEMSYTHVPPRSNAFSHELNRPNQRLGHPVTNGMRECRDNSSSESKAVSQSHSLKAPTKPMWVDVSVLPRIPKIKRESNVNTSMKNESNTSRSSNGSSYGMPETGISRLAGDKERHHSVDQQHGRTDGPRSRPDGAGSSSGFSSSFSSSSSSPAPHTNHQRFSSGGSSSSSSSVSFRISSSGNSWHSRRLNIASLTPSGSSLQEHCSKKEEEERKRQLRRDKQKLLASHSKDSNNIYDPFNPTESDSGSSDGESEGISIECSSRLKQEPADLKKKVVSRSRWDLKQGKDETQRPHSQNKPATTAAQEPCTEQLKGTKDNITFKKGSIFSHIEMPTPSNTTIKKEPESDTDEAVKRIFESETEDEAQPVEQRLNIIKIEETVTEGSAPEPPAALCDDRASATSNSSPVKKSEKTEIKYDSHNKNQSKESVSDKSTSKKKEPSKDQRARSSSTERTKKHSSPEQDRRHVRMEAKHEGGEKEKDKDKAKSSRRSRSKERRRTRRVSESSSSRSPDKASKKRRRSRSRSRSQDKRRSRSCSTSSSRERSRTKKHKRRSKERDEDKDVKRRSSKDKRRDRSRSKSRSRSHSRSRSRSRERRHARSKSRSRSRSRSRDRRKNESRHQSSRDKVESRSKDKKRYRSRSTSRERKKTREDPSTVKKPKNADTNRSSDKDKKPVKDKRKDDTLTVKSEKSERLAKSEKSAKSEKDDKADKADKTDKVDKADKADKANKADKSYKSDKSDRTEKAEKAGKSEKVSKMNKPSSSSSSSCLGVKKEPTETKVEENPCDAVDKKDKIKKEIKKEKCAVFDMFEGSPTSNIIKQEPVDTPVVVGEDKEKEDMHNIKTEECQLDKPEAKSPEEKLIVAECSIDDDVSATAVSTPPQDPPNESIEGPTISVKQETVHPSSDSDDDFNVDVMLDNLDLVKSKCDESTEATVKQEKDEKSDGEPAAAVGKTKPQVKRVTWNIEEPVGPQPDKSASKVALYKLKLKQEGIRRPSASASSQDLTGTTNAGDVTKITDPERSSGSDSSQGQSASAQGQGEDGDILKKDKTYLKKLHMQERAIEEVKLAIKPFYQKRDINKDEYKEILRKAVQKVCHSKSGEINPVKVGNLVKAYVDKYKHARKYKKGDEPVFIVHTSPVLQPLTDCCERAGVKEWTQDKKQELRKCSKRQALHFMAPGYVFVCVIKQLTLHNVFPTENADFTEKVNKFL